MNNNLYENLAKEIEEVLKEDDKVGKAIVEIIKYYEGIRPHVYKLKTAVEFENEAVGELDNTIKARFTVGSSEGMISRLLTYNSRIVKLVNSEYESAKFLRNSQSSLNKLLDMLGSLEEEFKQKGINPDQLYVGLMNVQEMVTIMHEIEDEEKNIRALERWVRVSSGKIKEIDWRAIWDGLGKLMARLRRARMLSSRGENGKAKKILKFIGERVTMLRDKFKKKVDKNESVDAEEVIKKIFEDL